MSQVYVIMGVSGCGKTAVGQALAAALDAPFYDGDDFHPPENVAKMASGVPLNDEDRHPWLISLHDLLAKHLARNESAVLACSALKTKYRDRLRQGNDGVKFVYLDGDFDTIWPRISARSGHYMKADLLQSQFEALEPPDADEALILSVAQPVDAILAQILRASQNEIAEK
ncbi:MAG: gluconokinase [Caldilineaceae bacterium]|nr:gluconokinase [Caldilineaceae bacterium]MBP8109110.1 gluconokinase [Caldilineaceae bacterium]MBP8122793.1 gluconokinase [Caldilineaceae bacterium]MBP9072064.1 gluconokinase [Caldilineaceae bacterium]